MGSSQKYWEYARNCARWAREANATDDQDVLKHMAEAWIRVALAEDDVVRQAAQTEWRTERLH
jgi:hypothetical protein